MNGIKYKDYFDFSGGYNDTTVQDTLKDNELSICENVKITQNGALSIRNGIDNINANSKGYDITKRFEYLLMDESRILEVYNKNLYKIGTTDILLKTLNSEKPYFLQQQNVLYICDGNEIYELGNKDYFSNIGTVDIKKDNIVQIADDFNTEKVVGNFYKAKSDLGSIDLSSQTYNSIAGKRTYTITNKGSVGDTVIINGITFASVGTIPTNNQFNTGTDVVVTTINLKNALALNATINTLYDLTVDVNTITMTEKIAGGGNTPTVATCTGAITITNGGLETSTLNANWEDVTDVQGVASNIIRTLAPYSAGKKEVVNISIFESIAKTGHITITINDIAYNINVTSGDTSWNVATKIAETTFTEYTAIASQNIVTLTAKEIGYKETCLVEPYDTGVSMVASIEINGESNDNILSEVKKCTKFIQHSKSGRYVATGNPKKPYAVYFSEYNQLNYFKQFNILTPTSSEGSPTCILNLLDSVLIGYRHSWYEYTGLEPATDGSWKRLAIPYGCVSEHSVQVVDLYSFIYLADNGLYKISANILSQYGITNSNDNAVKNISDLKVESTINTIFDKSKCVSVYHNGIYYLAFNDTNGNNDKILLYYPNYNAYVLYKDVIVNDFLYRKDGTLEFASTNYSIKFSDTKHYDLNVLNGESKRIVYKIATSKMTLDNNISSKFIDKFFIQANVKVDENIKYWRMFITTDYITKEMKLDVINDGLVWGATWGRIWGNYSDTVKCAFIRKKSTVIKILLTNEGLTDMGTNMTLYGFALSYKPFTPHQSIMNIGGK